MLFNLLINLLSMGASYMHEFFKKNGEHRNKFLSFCLELLSIVCFGVAALLIVGGFVKWDSFLFLGALGWIFMFVGLFLLNAWQRKGFRIYVTGFIFFVLLWLIVKQSSVFFIYFGGVAVLLVWLLLFLRKDGVSAWKLMGNTFSREGNRRLWYTMCGIVIIILLCSIISFKYNVDSNQETVWRIEKNLSTMVGRDTTKVLLRPVSRIEAETIKITVDSVSFNMVKVDGGNFIMGANIDDINCNENERPRHRVTLSDYYIGQTEVTQELYCTVLEISPLYDKAEAKMPITNVSYTRFKDFIIKLNLMTGYEFCLPTEAEWEFAARGGNKSRGCRYSGSDVLDDVGWYDKNSGDRPHIVATKQPNELGIFDMSGNVGEWCGDGYKDYSSQEQTDPDIPVEYHYCLRGGEYYAYDNMCKVSYRSGSTEDYEEEYIGFRLALHK